ncbi:hypothetical protein Ancab_029856 [Ancistrocladus abbreviatus]
MVIIVREYDENRDKEAVEKMERQCEFAGQKGKTSLVTDLLGDPLCRIRHYSTRIMMVAECEQNGELVGVIRGCIKSVTTGKKAQDFPVYIKLGYILGLRVSPSYRRQRIGTQLVKRVEEWCKERDAAYVYMATECTNEASVKLFTDTCGYVEFCNPAILVQPVHAHCKPLSSSIAIFSLPPKVAGSIYHQLFANSQLFPMDIDSILSNRLSLGTFVALPRKYQDKWEPQKGLPPSFAMLSVWNTKELFKLQVKGVSRLKQACCLGSRVLDAYMPWLRLPSIPNLFRPFGFYFIYGLHMEGKGSSSLMRSLCNFAHNMARDDVECGAIVAELAPADPVIEGVPYWKRFSLMEDLWCIKELAKHEGDELSNWIASCSSQKPSFVDPRDV